MGQCVGWHTCKVVGCCDQCCWGTNQNACIWCKGRFTEWKIYSRENRPRPPTCCCAATNLYMPLPRLATDDDSDERALEADAYNLYKAMKGCGTYDADLIRIIANRTPEQMLRIKTIFEEKWAHGDTLEQWIKDDTIGDWRNLLIMGVKGKIRRDAQLIHDAMDGIGTADEELRAYLTTRSNWELGEIQKTYVELFNKTMDSDIKGDTSFNYKTVLLAISKRAEYVAERLYKALKGAGTDDSRLVRILTSYPRDLSYLRKILFEFEDHFNIGLRREFEMELSMPDLQDIRAAYSRLFGGRDLVKDVIDDTTGNYQRICVELLKPFSVSTAEQIREALEGKGTNDLLLIEKMATTPPRVLQDTKKVFVERYGKSLEEQISSDVSGDYKKTLLALAAPREEVLAKLLHFAFEGPGTDDYIVMNTLTGRSRKEIRDIARYYVQIYGRTLEKDIRSETSFWYKRSLIYILRLADENMIRIPVDQVYRLRDVGQWTLCP